MASFIKRSHLQKNALLNIIQQRTRGFSNIRPLNIYATKKLTQHNSVVKTSIQQRPYAANYEPAPLEDEREGASILTNRKGDSPTTFEPTSEFASTNSTNLLESQATINIQDNDKSEQDWSKSFFGLSSKAFPQETIDILMAPIELDDIECKPDGLLYLPEIKYRRILNKAFGPGGWGLAPRGENSVSPKIISREYALVCHGRLVSVSRGEQEYFDPSGLATASEGAKSNALMRCCKDLGIASELWDPNFIRNFKKQYCEDVFVEHVVNKKKRRIWVRIGYDVEYPFVRT